MFWYTGHNSKEAVILTMHLYCSTTYPGIIALHGNILHTFFWHIIPMCSQLVSQFVHVRTEL